MLCRPLLYLIQDGAALCHRHHPPWRSHTKAKDENGGQTSSVSLLGSALRCLSACLFAYSVCRTTFCSLRCQISESGFTALLALSVNMSNTCDFKHFALVSASQSQGSFLGRTGPPEPGQGSFLAFPENTIGTGIILLLGCKPSFRFSD